MTQIAVITLVIEPIRYWSSTVAARPASTSASPIASLQTISPSRATAALGPGIRSFACASASRRLSLPASASRSPLTPIRGSPRSG